MKLNNIELSFDNFASEMAKLKNEKHFDYLVTIIGEDFGEEGLGCIYILENTQTNERCSVKTIAKKVDGSDVIPTVINLWKVADLLEREVFDLSASSSWVTQICAVSSSAPISRAIHCARTSI